MDTQRPRTFKYWIQLAVRFFNVLKRYAENLSKTTRRMQLVETKGWKINSPNINKQTCPKVTEYQLVVGNPPEKRFLQILFRIIYSYSMCEIFSFTHNIAFLVV